MKISDFCYVSDYVANGSFESLRNNVNYLDDGYAVLVRLTDFTKKWQSDFRYVSENAYKFLKHSKLYAGDLIMANVGDPGIVFIVPDLKKPMTLGPNSILIRPTSSVAHTKFIYWYFKSELGCDQITSITSATAQKKFNKTAFRALDIKLPPLAEQQRIAAVLDTADRILKQRESAIAKLDQLAQSVFVEMFGSSQNFENKKLSEVCDLITDGTHYTPTYVDNGVVFLSAKNVTKGTIDWNRVKYVPESLHEELQKRGLSSVQENGAEDLKYIKEQVISKLAVQTDADGKPLFDKNTGQYVQTAWYDDYLDSDGSKTNKVIVGLGTILNDPDFIKDNRNKFFYTLLTYPNRTYMDYQNVEQKA